MMVVRLDTEPTLTPGNPEILFDSGAFLFVTGPRAFDISPDGQRFLTVALGGAAATTSDAQIKVVQNWHQELLERVPIP